MIDVVPMPPAQPAGRQRSKVPDAAAVLLGLRRHMRKAIVVEPVDWFHIIRISALRHLLDSRNEAVFHDHHVGVMVIKRKIAFDFTKRILLRLASKTPCGVLIVPSLLSAGATSCQASLSDFYDISGW